MYELKESQKNIWTKKYKDSNDYTIENTWRRTAKWAASVEKGYVPHTDNSLSKYWEDKFFSILYDFVFIPGGRITEAAGTKSPFANNCFFLDIEDSLEHIFETVKRVAMISKKNGGCGLNFSQIRPADTPLSNGGTGSGVVSFMRVFDTSCDVIKTGSKNRRAALIALLDCDHPEIFEFVDAKRLTGHFENFNISVIITDAFMEAVRADADWDLKFGGKVFKTVKAKDLWNKLCESGYLNNDPGILFIDQVNKFNNLWYLFTLRGCNPCGELPLVNWGACCLGNINITKFIKNPFTKEASFDLVRYWDVITTAVRFLDNIIDASDYPFEQNREIAKRDRRIGLCGFAGLGDALAMMQLPYDSKEARAFVSSLARQCRNVAYEASVQLAKEKGSFESFDSHRFTSGNFVSKLPHELLGDIEEYGIRNSALLTCPPVGTGSMFAGNISSGIEPIFALDYEREILQPDGTKKTELMEDYAWSLYLAEHKCNKNDSLDIPDYFKTAMEIDPKDHILMQATIQEFTDGSISKTANVPEDYSLEDYKDLLMYAWENNLKGFTTFREGTRDGVLSTGKKKNKVEESGTLGTSATQTKPTRPRVLDGKTYQIREEGNHRTYCTFNHTEEKQPWEIFLYSSSRNSEWYAAIGRLASRIMRKTGDVQGVIDELMEIGGDNGYLTPEYGFVHSKPQHIALIMQEFVNGLAPTTKLPTKHAKCPECGEFSYIKEGGCSKCLDCGYSACG